MERVGWGEIKINSFRLNLMAVTETWGLDKLGNAIHINITGQ